MPGLQCRGWSVSSCAPSFIHSLIHSPIHSLSLSVTHSHSHPFTHSLTHSLAHSLTYGLTHSLSPAFTHSPPTYILEAQCAPGPVLAPGKVPVPAPYETGDTGGRTSRK